MANRHRAQARASGGRTFYAGAGSKAAKAVTAKHGFAAGGKADIGRATGGRAKGRGDFARGGKTSKFASGGSVMSSAHGGLGGSGGHAGAANAKRGGKQYASGGKVAEYAKGGKAKAFRHGGECKDDDDDDEDEDEYAEGGKVEEESELGSKWRSYKDIPPRRGAKPHGSPVGSSREEMGEKRGGVMHYDGGPERKPKGLR